MHAPATCRRGYQNRSASLSATGRRTQLSHSTNKGDDSAIDVRFGVVPSEPHPARKPKRRKKRLEFLDLPFADMLGIGWRTHVIVASIQHAVRRREHRHRTVL